MPTSPGCRSESVPPDGGPLPVGAWAVAVAVAPQPLSAMPIRIECRAFMRTTVADRPVATPFPRRCECEIRPPASEGRGLRVRVTPSGTAVRLRLTPWAGVHVPDDLVTGAGRAFQAATVEDRDLAAVVCDQLAFLQRAR